MACPRIDFHMHTKYLRCANQTMEVPAMVAECRRMGLEAIGITDHLNRPDKAPLHRPILEDIRRLETDLPVYFGVELNFMARDGEFAYNEELKEEYGFQFAIGGIHETYLDTYDQAAMVDIQHRHHLKTCENPLVQVLVHPYWFYKPEFDAKGFPWLESLDIVPRSYVRELGQVARQTNTAIELNCAGVLCGQTYGDRLRKSYVEFLAALAQEGVMFSVGSDSHDISMLRSVTAAWEVVESLGLPPERIWRPAGAPASGAAKVVRKKD